MKFSNVESLNSKQRVYVVAAPIKHDHLNNTAIVASHRLRPLATLYNSNWDSFRADFAENEKKKSKFSIFVKIDGNRDAHTTYVCDARLDRMCVCVCLCG